MGCDKDAVTPKGAQAKSEGSPRGPFVELRFSKRCNAAWARFTTKTNDTWRGRLQIKGRDPLVFRASPNTARTPPW
jgi:hypothetical protein